MAKTIAEVERKNFNNPDEVRTFPKGKVELVKVGGGLVLGLLPRGTPWADDYARLGQEGHLLYREAHFYTRHEVEDMLRQVRFRIVGIRSSLLQGPGQETYHIERPIDGWLPEAGFVGIAAVKGDWPGAD